MNVLLFAVDVPAFFVVALLENGGSKSGSGFVWVEATVDAADSPPWSRRIREHPGRRCCK